MANEDKQHAQTNKAMARMAFATFLADQHLAQKNGLTKPQKVEQETPEPQKSSIEEDSVRRVIQEEIKSNKTVGLNETKVRVVVQEELDAFKEDLMRLLEEDGSNEEQKETV